MEKADSSLDIEFLRTWIGKTQRRSDYACPSGAARIAALLDQETGLFEPGQAVPAAWYVMLFTATEPQSSLGRDGHPRTGDFLPPVPLPRRMFAGRRIDFHSDLILGEHIIRESTVADIGVKQGASGEMCFVTVRHSLSSDKGPVLVEEQDIVYRGEPPEGAPAKKKRPAERPQAKASYEIILDPTMLFRYSAITFNSHRIHYDLDYAREIEHYPALVANGGLTTLLLWDFAARSTGKKLKASRSRNMRPLFANSRITLNLNITGSSGRGFAWAENDQGDTAIMIDIEMEQQ